MFDIVRSHGFSGEDRDLILALRERAVAALKKGPVSVEILVSILPEQDPRHAELNAYLERFGTR